MTITLARVATEFLERPGVASSTLKSYELTLLSLLKEYGRWPIDLMSRQMLEGYINRRTDLSLSTRHRHRTIIQALFNFAVEKDYLNSNPLPRFKQSPMAQKSSAVRFFSSEQMTMLYQLVALDLRMHALISVLHRSGATVAEILALDLVDIDRVNRKFWVAGRGNRQRWCFYNADAAASLERYITSERSSDRSALFTVEQYFSKQVNRLTYRTVHKYWKDLIEHDAALENMRISDLRNTFINERVKLMTAQEINILLGTRSIRKEFFGEDDLYKKAEYIAQSAFLVLEPKDMV
jgi:integrase/recombinase XerD